MLHPDFITYSCLKIRKALKKAGTFFKKIGIYKFLNWIKKNQKLTAYLGSIFIAIQLFSVREVNNDLVSENKEMAMKLQSLRYEVAAKSAVMDNFDWAWYKKVKRGRNFIISGMNQRYEDVFGLDKIESLGKTNFELVPYEAARFFNSVDSLVAATGIPKDTIEPWIKVDSSKIKLYTHKWRTIEVRDTIVQGVSIPLAKFVAVIDDEGNLEVIEIVPDTLKNAVQDTIYKLN